MTRDPLTAGALAYAAFTANPNHPRALTPDERFDLDAVRARDALNHYLDGRDADAEVAAMRRENAVASVMDWLTNAEIAEAFAWSKVRSAGRIAA